MRKLSGISLVPAAALIATACLAEREPVAPTTGTKVRVALNVEVRSSNAARRVVEIRARYRRVTGEQPTLPTQPTQVIIEDGATIEQAVVIDVGACNSDPTRIRDGEAEGCRFSIELTLKNSAGETLGSDTEEVGPVGPGPQSQTTPTFVLSTPSLTVEPSNVGFAARVQQGLPAAQNVVVNSDNSSSPLGNLSASIAYANGQGWLAVTTDQAAHSIGLRPTTTALAIGTYRATVTVASSVDGMKPQTISVTYQVTEQPTLVVTGAGDGVGTVTSTPSGISCSIRSSATSGTCTARFEPNASITLRADPTGGDRFGGWSGPCSGQGTCVVTLAQSLSVTARFNAPAPVLTLSPTSLSFTGVSAGTNPPRQTVSIVNGGGGILTGVSVSGVNYPSTPPSQWLDAFVSGTSVSVGASPLNLPTGTHTGTVVVASTNGGTATLNVTIVVSPRPPELRLSPTSLSFSGVSGGAGPARQNVTVRNDGGGTLAGVAIGEIRYGGSATGWLTPALSGATITVAADPSKLAAGNYTATVTVTSSNGGSASFTVSFAVTWPPPRLVITPTQLEFIQIGGNVPGPRTLQASNGSGGPFADLGTLSVDTRLTSGRLSIRFDGSTIVVTPNLTNLEGRQQVQAVITSSRGGSVTITVWLEFRIFLR